MWRSVQYIGPPYKGRYRSGLESTKRLAVSGCWPGSGALSGDTCLPAGIEVVHRYAKGGHDRLVRRVPQGDGVDETGDAFGAPWSLDVGDHAPAAVIGQGGLLRLVREAHLERPDVEEAALLVGVPDHPGVVLRAAGLGVRRDALVEPDRRGVVRIVRGGEKPLMTDSVRDDAGELPFVAVRNDADDGVEPGIGDPGDGLARVSLARP